MTPQLVPEPATSGYLAKEMSIITDILGSDKLALFTMMKQPGCLASQIPSPTCPTTIGSWVDPAPVGFGFSKYACG